MTDSHDPTDDMTAAGFYPLNEPARRAAGDLPATPQRIAADISRTFADVMATFPDDVDIPLGPPATPGSTAARLAGGEPLALRFDTTPVRPVDRFSIRPVAPPRVVIPSIPPIPPAQLAVIRRRIEAAADALAAGPPFRLVESTPPVRLRLRDRIDMYVDRRDWWIGVYRGPNHLYVCLLPCLVIRVAR